MANGVNSSTQTVWNFTYNFFILPSFYNKKYIVCVFFSFILQHLSLSVTTDLQQISKIAHPKFKIDMFCGRLHLVGDENAFLAAGPKPKKRRKVGRQANNLTLWKDPNHKAWYIALEWTAKSMTTWQTEKRYMIKG